MAKRANTILELQIEIEELEITHRQNLIDQIWDELNARKLEIADVVYANPKLQNHQVANFLKRGKNINTSTLNQIAMALGGEICFVPRKTRRRRK